MTEQEFRQLVNRHARDWANAGTALSGLLLDPMADAQLQEAKQTSRELIEAFRGASPQGSPQK